MASFESIPRLHIAAAEMQQKISAEIVSQLGPHALTWEAFEGLEYSVRQKSDEGTISVNYDPYSYGTLHVSAEVPVLSSDGVGTDKLHLRRADFHGSDTYDVSYRGRLQLDEEYSGAEFKLWVDESGDSRLQVNTRVIGRDEEDRYLHDDYSVKVIGTTSEGKIKRDFFKPNSLEARHAFETVDERVATILERIDPISGHVMTMIDTEENRIRQRAGHRKVATPEDLNLDRINPDL